MTDTAILHYDLRTRILILCRCVLATLTLLSIAIASAHAAISNSRRLSVGDAEQLVAAWLQTHRPHDGTAWHRHPPLKDITPEDVWTRLGAQVFKQRDFTESVEEVDAFLIKQSKVYPLSIGFGGWGLTSMCVCDLDQDAKPELAYTYSWGSGLHRSHLAVFCLDQPSPGKIETDFQYKGDLLLKRENDQTVSVYVSYFAAKSKPVQ